MFSIVSRGVVIGHSELEHGDPPMCVAFGRFVPDSEFDAFSKNRPPEVEDSGVQRWVGLSILTAKNVELKCSGVVLARYDLGCEVEFEITVLGISSPPYETLFSHHVQSYHDRFRASGE